MDCNNTLDFMEVEKDICERGCTKCPLSQKHNGTDLDCSDLKRECPKKYIEILQKWADENYITYQEDFFKKYPDAPKETDGTPVAPWCNIYGTGRCTNYGGDCKDCWKKAKVK